MPPIATPLVPATVKNTICDAKWQIYRRGVRGCATLFASAIGSADRCVRRMKKVFKFVNNLKQT